MSLLHQARSIASRVASSVYHDWGETFVRQGHLKKAIQSCTRAIELAPHRYDASFKDIF